MTRSYRVRLIVAMVATILVIPTISAAAAEGDLASYFERAAAAEFSGDQVLACNTPVGLRDSAAHLAQRDGVLYISAGVDGAPAISAGAGMLAITGPAGSATAVQVVAATEPPVGYQISATKQVTYLQRSADELTLTTGGKARVRLTFDQGTGALLRSETLNSDGSVYCTTSMTSFVSSVPKVPTGTSVAARKLEKDTDFPAEVFPVDAPSPPRGLLVEHEGDGYTPTSLPSPSSIPVQFSVTDISDARTGPVSSAVFTLVRPARPSVWDTRRGGMALHGYLPRYPIVVLAGLNRPRPPYLLRPDPLFVLLGLAARRPLLVLVRGFERPQSAHARSNRRNPSGRPPIVAMTSLTTPDSSRLTSNDAGPDCRVEHRGLESRRAAESERIGTLIPSSAQRRFECRVSQVMTTTFAPLASR